MKTKNQPKKPAATFRADKPIPATKPKKPDEPKAQKTGNGADLRAGKRG